MIDTMVELSEDFIRETEAKELKEKYLVYYYSLIKIKKKKSLMDFIHLFPSLQERREKLKKHEFDSQGEK